MQSNSGDRRVPVRSARRRALAWSAVVVIVLIALASVMGTRSWWAPMSEEASHARMVDQLASYARLSLPDNNYLGTRRLDQVRERFAALDDSAPADMRWTLLYLQGKLELHQGHEAEAIELLHRAEALLPSAAEQLPDEAVTQFLFDLGAAYLRMGETQNCCQLVTAESCIIPIQPGGVHERREGSEKASEYFLQVLRRTAHDSVMHLSAQWLLNIAAMTLGEHPDGVPAEHRIADLAPRSEQPFPRFPNIARQAGVAHFSLAGGAIADDFDNDGSIDLVVSSWDPNEALRIYWNRDGRFVDGSQGAGLDGIFGGLNLIQADYDNDGFLDILVLRGGWLVHQGRLPSSLLRNRGDGTFVDVTYAAGLARHNHPSQTASWADYDLDGDLDLFKGNESLPENPAPCQLFRNNGDGTFTDVAEQAGVLNGFMAKAVVWGDYDADRRPDLFVSNFGAANRLYHNQGDGTFVDVAPQLGLTEPIHSFPCWFWDYDNDGALDLFVAAYSGGIAELAAHAAGVQLKTPAPVPRLYRNDGHGRLSDVAASVNLTRPHLPMGANFGDLDNDGFLDFYLGTGWPEYHELMPNAMYRNDSGQRFLDVTTAGGFGHLQKGHGVALADFDGDGDLDVFEQMGGFFAGDRFYDVLYENPGFDNHWIGLRLVGTTTNRCAIGARVRLDITGPEGERSVYRWINSGGTFGANPLRQLIGVGQADVVRAIEVFWPVTGKTERFEQVEVDRWWTITEGKGELEALAAAAKP